MTDIQIMGVLNITDNSFYDGGKYNDPNKSIKRAKILINEGVDIIDIGAESSKPGSESISCDIQIRKIEPVVDAIRGISDVSISIDTRSSYVISRLIKYNINIVNDISSLEDRDLLSLVKENDLIVSLMHMKGTPKDMQDNPTYANLVEEIYSYLAGKIKLCTDIGITKNKIIIDPGFGFGKTLDHNYIILNNLGYFKNLDCKLLAGISRKSMIGNVIDKPASDRLYGSLAATMLAIRNEVNILRVHDVKETKMLLNFKDLITKKS